MSILKTARPGFSTEGFAAPEQYLGYTDARSDIYELGASLHFLITRRDPREEEPFTNRELPRFWRHYVASRKV